MVNKFLKYFKLVYKKPLLVFRIIFNYLCLYAGKKGILRKVDICLTLQCTCACDKCSSAKMLNPKMKELCLNEIKEAVKQCIRLGAIQFNLTGGDPLLSKDIFKIIKALQPSKTFISINTTGWLLDKEVIQQLRKLGVDMIKMSLDSPHASEHDRYRNSPGCYQKVMENLQLIKAAGGVRSHISTVVIPENIRNGKLFDIVSLAEEFNATLALTIPSPAGKWSGTYNNLITGNDRKILNELLKKHLLVTQDIDSCYRKNRCPGGTESLYITCYGDVIPCSVLQISFGNIREESLKTIYKRMAQFPPLKKSVNVCKAGESKSFINKWLKPIAKYDLFPVNIFDHPSFSRNKDNT